MEKVFAKISCSIIPYLLMQLTIGCQQNSDVEMRTDTKSFSKQSDHAFLDQIKDELRELDEIQEKNRKDRQACFEGPASEYGACMDRAELYRRHRSDAVLGNIRAKSKKYEEQQTE